jgi:hypothetical protein
MISRRGKSFWSMVEERETTWNIDCPFENKKKKHLRSGSNIFIYIYIYIYFLFQSYSYCILFDDQGIPVNQLIYQLK